MKWYVEVAQILFRTYLPNIPEQTRNQQIADIIAHWEKALYPSAQQPILSYELGCHFLVHLQRILPTLATSRKNDIRQLLIPALIVASKICVENEELRSSKWLAIPDNINFKKSSSDKDRIKELNLWERN